jgi:amino acid adenylation domain-containing protein
LYLVTGVQTCALPILFEQTELTYRELNERSNQLAHYLRDNYDIQPDDLIGIKQERSEWMIVSILGALKSGGAYVPIDPQYPQERIDYIEKDTNCKVCVDETQLSKFREDQERYSKEPVTTTAKEDHLAYVIYTSGSTGRPKGVMIAHKGIYNRLLWAQNFYRFTADDRILQKTTFCFDVSVWELLWPLLAGARLVFAKPGGQGDTNYLLQLIERENITALHFVPSMLEQFLMDMPAGRCTGLKKVLCSGEALKALHVHRFREKLPHAALHNLYGPTEASIDVTYWAMPEKGIEELRTVPIGRPVSNTQIFILEKNGKPVPVGVAGEICIGGVQLANGYLNKPELTRERFVEHPFLKEKGIDKIYRTGDLGRWLPDGEIEFLGRQDNQVKIRGFRIEPDEVAFVLLQCPLVKQAVVVVAKGGDGDRLVAYIVPNNAFDKTGIVTYMQARLPEYMIPGLLVEIPFVPLTLSGKLDRKALPDIVLSHEYEEPVNELEWELCAIWQMLLGVDKVGRRDNFFELGGHSILAIRMIAAIRSKLLTDIRVNELFRNPTVAALAEQIKLSQQRLSGENEGYEEITI